MSQLSLSDIIDQPNRGKADIVEDRVKVLASSSTVRPVPVILDSMSYFATHTFGHIPLA